jgi:hypothetical protein
MEKRNLAGGNGVAVSTVAAGKLTKEDSFLSKHELGGDQKGASYCCEAAATLSVDSLPQEKAFI